MSNITHTLDFKDTLQKIIVTYDNGKAKYTTVFFRFVDSTAVNPYDWHIMTDGKQFIDVTILSMMINYVNTLPEYNATSPKTTRHS